MKAFFAEEQKRHDPKAFLSSGASQPNPEKPERVERLLAGARAAGCEIVRPRNFGLAPIAAVHTPEGTPVELSVSRRAKGIEFVVRDHGKGLAEGEERRVFGKFYRSPGSPAGGTGLGLSIVRRLVELMGG